MSDSHQVPTEDCEGEGGAPFVFRSRPNRSLTRAQERLFFWSVAALCFLTASALALLGYWLVLPFAGLEVGILAWALGELRRHDADFESLLIDGDVVVFEWRSGGQSGRREMNRRWVRVQCGCQAPRTNCRLSLSSHGRATEVGQYLSDEARLQLAARLRRRLQA